MNQKIENIIVKFLMNAANIEELEALTDWLKKPENKQYFKNYVRINYAMDINMKQFDTENAKKEYLSKIKQAKSIFYKSRVYSVLKYAAAAVIVFGMGYFFKDNIFKPSIETPRAIVNKSANSIEPGTDKATLTLEDGSVIALEKGISFQIQNVNSNGEQIVYDSGERESKQIAYNYLTIPRGGQFHIVLSDGTEVWLNSESQLKYPVGFVAGETRKVELVYGEAYFDVSPSTQHKGSKFQVFNKSQLVEVIGTEFNIKAYKDESNIYTTLVEGKVSINSDGQSKKLIPGEQSNLDLENKNITIAKVDANAEASWRNGIFSFRGKPLKEIMKVISRWYDVDVVFENKKLEEITFKGVLGKNQDIQEIFETIKSLSVIKKYEINGKKIILK